MFVQIGDSLQRAEFIFFRAKISDSWIRAKFNDYKLNFSVD